MGWLCINNFICLDLQFLEDFCNPIVNKPKPKVEPPKEEKKVPKNGEDGGEKKENCSQPAKEETQKENDSQQQDSPPSEQPPKSASDLDMEIDWLETKCKHFCQWFMSLFLFFLYQVFSLAQ